MHRFTRLVGVLRCPDCSQQYSYQAIGQRDPGLGVFGLLNCPCKTWPVIDSIPILLDRQVGAYRQSGETLAIGPSPAALVEMIRAGRGRQAPIECLAVPYVPGGNSWNERPSRLGRKFNSYLRRYAAPLSLGKAIRRRQLERFLATPADRVSAGDLIRLFYGPGSPLPIDYAYYFLYRFSLPRWLAAMSLMSLIPPTPRPVLDLACGFGHFAHFLRGQGITDWVVGADFNFIPMWMARRTSARNVSFVVLDANAPLPLTDDVFGAGLCSDAFIYIANQSRLVAEIKRVCGDHVLALPRLGNRTALPAHPGASESSAEEYIDLFGAPERSWIFSEDVLVKDYLSRRTPDLDVRDDPGNLTHDKWLSLFVAPEGMVRPPQRRHVHWPHEMGRLQLNPIFTAHTVDRTAACSTSGTGSRTPISRFRMPRRPSTCPVRSSSMPQPLRRSARATGRRT